jgi:PAS domain S-box-containing protein
MEGLLLMRDTNRTKEQLINELADLRTQMKILTRSYNTLKKAKTRAENDWHVLFNRALDALLIINGDTGRILEANHTTETLLGYKESELADKPFSMLFSDQSEPDFTKTIEKVRMYDNVIVETFRRSDGTDCVMDITVNMIPWGKDSVFLVALRDVSERVKAEKERESLVKELQEAMEKIKTLKGIVPICAHCKKIRNDEGFWQQVEVYVHEHSEAEFSHGICPECIRELYPEIADSVP